MRTFQLRRNRMRTRCLRSVGSLAAVSALMCALATTTVCCGESVAKPNLRIEGSVVFIKTPAGKDQKLVFDHTIVASDITVQSLSFGRFADLKVLDTEGANQKLYKVFLYHPDTGLYVFNSKLSNIPCLEVDQRRKQLIGACFHASACENWTERYKFSPPEKLSLVERAGTYCDAAGEGYEYIEKYSNGKTVSSTVRPAR